MTNIDQLRSDFTELGKWNIATGVWSREEAQEIGDSIAEAVSAVDKDVVRCWAAWVASEVELIRCWRARVRQAEANIHEAKRLEREKNERKAA